MKKLYCTYPCLKLAVISHQELILTSASFDLPLALMPAWKRCCFCPRLLIMSDVQNMAAVTLPGWFQRLQHDKAWPSRSVLMQDTNRRAEEGKLAFFKAIAFFSSSPQAVMRFYEVKHIVSSDYTISGWINVTCSLEGLPWLLRDVFVTEIRSAHLVVMRKLSLTQIWTQGWFCGDLFFLGKPG